MIREIIVDIREGDQGKRILDAILRELNYISLEQYDDVEDDCSRVEKELDFIELGKIEDFPGHVVINIFDENEELMEVIET